MNGFTFDVLVMLAEVGAKVYWTKYLPLVLLVISVVSFVKLAGLLNLGNLSRYNPDKMPKNANRSLEGKRIVFLGSSVTKGFAAYGKSFVDMIAARDGAVCIKEAVSGTTLVDNGPKSYISRLKKLAPDTACDVFVCQLSTNDAIRKLPLGGISKDKNYDTKTVCGAIEYIISYVKERWSCPIVFYTNPEFASVAYAEMVNALNEIAKKSGASVIDLWNDKEINTETHKKHSYMNDEIHPTKKGYRLWTPLFEDVLTSVLAGKTVPERAKTEPPVTLSDTSKKQSTVTVKRVINYALLLVLIAIIVMICGAINAAIDGLGII